MIRVGIIGCGTIGSGLARAIQSRYARYARVIALADQSDAPARKLQQQLTTRPRIATVPEVIRRSHLIIEAATASISAQVAAKALQAHRDVLVMSTGGLLTGRSAWQRAARTSRGRLYVPSGALCGIDGIKAMAIGTIRRVRLTTRKPPAALAGAPLVAAKGIDLSTLREPALLFEGSPLDVVRAFPQNTNIAATLTLACQPSGTRWSVARAAAITIRVFADPGVTQNIHELEVDGDCGTIRCRLENVPSATNPKTSELAIRSALATLQQLFEPVRIGT